MDVVNTHLQSSVQNPLQQQTQTSPLPGDPSPPNVPEDSVTPRPPPASDANDIDAETLKKLRNAELRELGRTFGNIPDVPIFSEWAQRLDCSNAAVHRSIVAGICGNTKEGVYSVAVSGLYKDDEDGGEVILYTGTGGRRRWSDANPPKRLRLGPQTEDQSWDMPQNKALIVSFHTGNPVRVIRSWRCRSQYAPLRGYRYDGLYKVAAYWTAKGSNGKKICRCRLERLPGQPPIPVRPIALRASRRLLRERLVSHPTSNPLTCTNDVDVGRNQTTTSPMQSAGGTEGESGGLPSASQERALSETHTICEEESDVKVPQSSSHQRQVSPKPNGVLPIYKWDPKKHELVRVPASQPIQEHLDTGEGDEEEHRGEDDATLVSSEDGHVNERMEGEYFSEGVN